MTTFGEKISPVLVEIEGAILDFEVAEIGKPDYSQDAFRAAMRIFMSAMLDKVWELQENENMGMANRCAMAEKLGNELRQIVKTYTNIDTTTLYA